MATHGTIGEYDGNRETCMEIIYTERLVQYFAANNVEFADKKRAILLSVAIWSYYVSTYQKHSCTGKLNRTHVRPIRPEVVEQHRNLKPSVLVQRYNFNTRKQQPGESISTQLYIYIYIYIYSRVTQNHRTLRVISVMPLKLC